MEKKKAREVLLAILAYGLGGYASLYGIWITKANSFVSFMLQTSYGSFPSKIQAFRVLKVLHTIRMTISMKNGTLSCLFKHCTAASDSLSWLAYM